MAGLLGILIAFSLWWIYFDTTANRTVKPGIWFHNLWLYMHFLMYMTITATGAGVLSVVEHAGHELSANVRWLLGSSVGLSLIVMGLLQIAFRTYPGIKPIEHRRDMFFKFLAGALTLTVTFFANNIGALLMLTLLWFMLIVIIFYIFKIWLRLRQEGLVSINPEHHSH